MRWNKASNEMEQTNQCLGSIGALHNARLAGDGTRCSRTNNVQVQSIWKHHAEFPHAVKRRQRASGEVAARMSHKKNKGLYGAAF